MDDTNKSLYNSHQSHELYTPISLINPASCEVSNFLREDTSTQPLPHLMRLTPSRQNQAQIQTPILTRNIRPKDITLKISPNPSLCDLEIKITNIQRVSPEMTRLECIKRINTQEQIDTYHNKKSSQISERAIHAIIQRLLISISITTKNDCLTEIYYYVRNYCHIDPSLIHKDINEILNDYAELRTQKALKYTL